MADELCGNIWHTSSLHSFDDQGQKVGRVLRQTSGLLLEWILNAVQVQGSNILCHALAQGCRTLHAPPHIQPTWQVLAVLPRLELCEHVVVLGGLLCQAFRGVRAQAFIRMASRMGHQWWLGGLRVVWGRACATWFQAGSG